jgi:serine/threonine protein kinase
MADEDKKKSKKITSLGATSDKLNHSFLVYDIKFTVDARYKPWKPIGRGAYGCVCSALDQKHNRKVAIKKVTNAFEDLIDAKRILREIKLLRHFNHENVVGIRDLVEPKGKAKLEDIYIVSDLMDTDLHKVIYSKNTLSNEHIQYFVYQMLRGLKYIHSADVIHRDLKPPNLLVNENCDLKICDLGLARGVNDQVEMTEYVVTRWYRAPEVMCAAEYSKQIDVWSVGCILAELLGKKPLFPGQDYISQMELIFSIVGTPSDEDMKTVTNENAFQFIRKLKKQKRVPFEKLYPQATAECLDLLDKMLTFNPHKRITVEQALAHPYLSSLVTDRDLHSSDNVCKDKFDFTFEDKLQDDLSKSTLQKMFWEEIYNYRPHLKK